MSSYKVLIALTSLLFVATSQADDSDTVYMYKNSQGEIEFTDVVKENKKAVAQKDYQKMTEQEKKESEEKLEQIIADDKVLDEQLAKERQQDLKRQQEAERKLKQSAVEVEPTEMDTQNNSYYPNNRVIRPRPKPLPARPIVRPGSPR